jgi:hypothetical protein
MERKPNGLLLFVLGHVLLAAWTWRDIRQRPTQQIRGSKRFWRLLSAVNTLGSAGYWLVGRRYGPNVARTTAREARSSPPAGRTKGR